MTELLSSNPPEMVLDIKVWNRAVEELRKTCCLPDECLKGWSVRVRHSRQEPYRSLGNALKEVLKAQGAELNTLDDLEHALSTKLQPRPLDSIDAFLMVAGTTGVSAEAMELSHEKATGGAAFSERTVVTLPKGFGEGFIRKRLNHHGVKVHLYEQTDVANGNLCVRVISDIIAEKRQFEMLKNERKPRIGILTALPVEFDAMVAQLGNVEHQVSRVDEVIREYVFGTLPGRNGGHHEIVVARSGVGTNISATLTERLFRDFNLEDILMVGIAGGIPRVDPKDEDIRLGDVVLSGRKGVVQYDMVKIRGRGEQQANNPMPPSRAWTTLAEGMPSSQDTMKKYNDRLKKAQAETAYKRPSGSTDVLRNDSDPKSPKTIRRAKDPRRKTFASLAFVGAVGSANRVVKSHKERERVRKSYGVIAVEMEGAGVAEAAMSNGRPFFLVRGICDYANNSKNDKWHGYAAMAAATFAATLIEAMPLSEKTDDP